MIVRTASNLRAALFTLIASASASTDYVSWRQVSATSELGSGDPGFEATGPSVMPTATRLCAEPTTGRKVCFW